MSRSVARRLARHTGAASPDPAAVRRFIVRFGVVLVAFAAIQFAPGYEKVVEISMSGMAVIVHGVLHLFGETVRLAGMNLFSDACSITVAQECSALDLVAFYTATIVAFPAMIWQRLAGIAAGLTALGLLNVTRIASLFLVGAHWPARFSAVHEGLWPVVLAGSTLVLCAAWMRWVSESRAV